MTVKNSILIFISLIIYLSITNLIYASPPPPAPKCSIVGTIKAVRFEPSFEDPCLKQGRCPTDMELTHPERYYLSVGIDKVSTIGSDTKYFTCEKLFPLNSIREIFINKDKVINNNIFEKGQNIAGVVSTFGNSKFESYRINELNKLDGIRVEINKIIRYFLSIFKK